ncbi:MAG: hypothetical protein WBO55_01870 [Rhizobiaceae bacterium]
MPLQVLIPMIVGGLALCWLAIRMLGLSHEARLASPSDAARLLQQDYPDARVEEIILATDGKAAVLHLEDGANALVEAMGDRYVTRLFNRHDIASVERSGDDRLVLQLRDFTLPRVEIVCPSTKAALKAASWFEGGLNA